MKPIRRVSALFLVLAVTSACAAQKPVLFSNPHLMRVGPGAAEQDIEACIAYAEAGIEAGQTPDKENPIADAATDSVAGAAAGGAGGAIFGHAGQGAAAGAVGGAVGTLTHALLQGRLFRRQPPEPFRRQLVERCLREKGYEPAGWK